MNKELLDKAYGGDKDAQRIVFECYAFGTNGLERNIEELKRLADLGWDYAKRLVILME